MNGVSNMSDTLRFVLFSDDIYFIDTAVQHYLDDVLYTSISYTTGMFSLWMPEQQWSNYYGPHKGGHFEILHICSATNIAYLVPSLMSYINCLMIIEVRRNMLRRISLISIEYLQ